MKKSLLFLLILSVFTAKGDVFSLWPFRGGSELVDSSDTVLNPKTLWDEVIIADGQKIKMNVAMVETTLPECLTLLRKHFPKARFAVNPGTILMEQKGKNGGRERILLIAVKGMAPVLRFSMELPAGKLKPSDWPQEFPLPPGAVPLSVMEFPARDALYASFSTQESVSSTLTAMAGNLAVAGWTPVSGESKNALSGSGEVFIRNTSNQMLVLGIKKDGKSGETTCSIYRRKLKE